VNMAVSLLVEAVAEDPRYLVAGGVVSTIDIYDDRGLVCVADGVPVPGNRLLDVWVIPGRSRPEDVAGVVYNREGERSPQVVEVETQYVVKMSEG